MGLVSGGIAGPVLFTLVTLLVASQRPGYSHMSQFISELGETGAPNAVLMNYAGLLTGLLLMGFALALRRTLAPGALAGLAALTVAVFGGGVALAGLFPCDPGCPLNPTSTAGRLHNLVIIGLAVVGLAPVLTAVRFRKLAGWTSFVAYSLATGFTALLLFMAFVSALEGAWRGLLQRALLGVVFVWFILIAGRMIAREGCR